MRNFRGTLLRCACRPNQGRSRHRAASQGRRATGAHQRVARETRARCVRGYRDLRVPQNGTAEKKGNGSASWSRTAARRSHLVLPEIAAVANAPKIALSDTDAKFVSGCNGEPLARRSATASSSATYPVARRVYARSVSSPRDLVRWPTSQARSHRPRAGDGEKSYKGKTQRLSLFLLSSRAATGRHGWVAVHMDGPSYLGPASCATIALSVRASCIASPRCHC